MSASVANMMQIHVYTFCKHGKCRICSVRGIGVANVAFTKSLRSIYHLWVFSYLESA